MGILNMHTYTTTLMVLVISFVAACSSQPRAPFEEIVRGDQGESLTQSSEPLRMVAPRAALSRVGKDYLFVAPVTVRENNSSKNYLWFSFGSTLDRRLTGSATPKVKAIVLVVDGMPMTFDLVPWSEVASSEPFELGVEHYSSFSARVTGSQLHRISSAGELSAFVTNGADRSPVYALSDGEFVEWSAFLP